MRPGLVAFDAGRGEPTGAEEPASGRIGGPRGAVGTSADNAAAESFDAISRHGQVTGP
ncbi:hypothetical protein [Streptomyces sp. NPDC018000]|uniref:hypothetical protein n=1 Tax=Streptomyces sp. NPDC018000 TaxID=3365028 RepID=UPI0037B394E9